MRVLQICGYFPPYILGGDATAAYSYMKALNTQSIENDVIFWPIKQSKKSIIVSVNKNLSNIIYRIRQPILLYAFSRFFNINLILENEIINFLNRQKKPYDILQFHSTVFGSHLFTRLKKKFNSKIVVTQHDYTFICPKMILLDPSNDDCTKKSNLIDCTKCQIQSKIIPVCTVWKSDIKSIDQFISPSDYLKKIHLKSDKMFSGKIKTIHNAIQDPKNSKYVDEKSLMDSSKFNVLFVGRLEKEKGVLDLVKAFQQLDENFHLYIVGTGRLLNNLQSSNLVRVPNSKISVLGPVSSEILNKCYMECNVVCLPSAWKENCSMVLIEALSYGKPCITTNQGGNPEIIVDNKNGFIVNVHSPNEITLKIIELSQNNALYESMCKEAQSIYEKEFSLTSLGKNLNQLYSELLKNNKKIGIVFQNEPC